MRYLFRNVSIVIVAVISSALLGCNSIPLLDQIPVFRKADPPQTSAQVPREDKPLEKTKQQAQTVATSNAPAPEAEIARKYVLSITSPDGDARSKLVEALVAADFPVLDKNAKPITLNGKSGSGIRIRAWEVSALHAMTKSEWVIPLSSVEKILRAISEDESVPWAKYYWMECATQRITMMSQLGSGHISLPSLEKYK